jgi:short-subunit dehydrogenase
LSAWRILPIHADYSASKCAVEAYLEALRVRLRGRAITVTTVSPGFVRTPMMAGKENLTALVAFAIEADDAARRILRGIDRRQNYVAFPWHLALGTRLLRAMPEPLWRLALPFITPK